MGLYNDAEKLWWRDKDFVPPYKEPNGGDCYWSRGNGVGSRRPGKNAGIASKDRPALFRIPTGL